MGNLLWYREGSGRTLEESCCGVLICGIHPLSALIGINSFLKWQYAVISWCSLDRGKGKTRVPTHAQKSGIVCHSILASLRSRCAKRGGVYRVFWNSRGQQMPPGRNSKDKSFLSENFLKQPYNWQGSLHGNKLWHCKDVDSKLLHICCNPLYSSTEWGSRGD